MHGRWRTALAITFSLLLVSAASVGPALAGQVYERLADDGVPDAGPPGGGPPGGGQDGVPDNGTGGSGNGNDGSSGGPPDGGEPPGDGGPPTDAPGGDGASGTPTPGNGNDGTNGDDDDGGHGSGSPTDAAGRGNGNGGAGNGGGPPAGTPASGENGSDGDAARGPPAAFTNDDVDLGPNATALDHRLAAYRLLADATASGPGNSGAARKQRLFALLNGTFRYHLDEYRVTSAALFKTDMRVAAPLHRRAPNVTRHLVVADRKLAATAIEDVSRTRAVLRARNVTFDEAAVADNLSAARAAYDRGRSLPEQARHARVQHYRRAWTHAQRAVDVMDEAVVPNVTVEERPDLPHVNATTVNVTGTVFDVRPYELTANLSVGNETERITLAAGTAPATTATFDESVTLERQFPRFVNGSLANDATVRVVEVNVTARDPGTDLADRGYDADERRDLHGPQTGTAALYFDGDGLPGGYERRVTGTDPLDPDSDVAATGANESGDGVIDGLEDLENDTLATFREFRAGTDPLDPDTDGDDLTDAFEIRWRFDPLVADGDGDGVPDGAEDPDDDGLENLGEQDAGAAPVRNDTDRDGLGDGREVDDLGTDPTAEDTDDDGLADADELVVGTVPTDPDTDDDGTLDGSETFTTTTGNESLGVSVAVTGQGNAASGVEVEPAPRFGRGPAGAASASPVVAVRSDAPFDSARVTVAYDEGRVRTNETDLVAFRFDREAQTFVPLPTTVNAADDTVTAETNRPGPVVVMAESAWDDQIPDESELPDPERQKDTFGRPGPDCSGFCESSGDAIVVGVTGAGRGELPGGSLSVETAAGVTGLRSYSGPGAVGAEDGTDDSTADDGAIEYVVDGLSVNRTVDNGTVVYESLGTLAVASDGDDATITTNGTPVAGTGSAGTLATQSTEESFDVTTFATIDTSRASEVVFTVDVRGKASTNESVFQIVADGTRGTDTLFSVSCETDCPRRKSASIRADLSDIAGDELKLQFRTKGGGSLFVDSFDVRLVFDSDGDGVPDGSDLCAGTPGVQENGCPPSSYEALTLTFDQPVERVRVRASGVTAVEESGSRVALVALDSDAGTPDESRHVLFEQTAVDARSFDVERTITDVGTRLRLRLVAEGTAAIGLDSLVVEVDTDGDGLWNHEERGGVWHPVYGAVELDPTDPDTDGDGLQDDAEVGEPQLGTGQFGVYYKLDSRPDRVDTDGDGFRDGAEVRAFESEPKDEDTDGDGFPDFQDLRPTVDDRPPEVELSDLHRSGALLEVTDEHAPIESVTVRPYYPSTTLCPAEWRPDLSVINKTFDIYSFANHPRSLKCSLNLPTKYYVNVTDANGNGVSYLVDFSKGSGPFVQGVIFFGRKLAIPEDPNVADDVVGIGLFVAGAALLDATFEVNKLNAPNTAQPAISRVTEPVARYRVDGHTVKLPRGTARTTVDPATGEAITHGFGWAYVAATITEEKEVPADEEITQSELRRMVENGKVVVEEGVKYIVTRGGPLPPEARLLLRVVGGQIVGYTVREVMGGGRDDDREGDEELEVHHINVGKGSSTLVEAPNGETMLVDAGGGNRNLARRVRTYLESEGIDTIDYLVLTHTHADHIRGVIPLLQDESIDVEAVYYSGLRTNTSIEGRVLKAIEDDPSTELHTIRTGDGEQISPGSVDLDVLNPPDTPRSEWPEDSKKWDDSNAFVLKLSYEGETFLLPSDIRGPVESELGKHLGVTTMTASHHGSGSGNTVGFYGNTTPKRVVVTAGAGGPQTPPDREVFDTLAQFDTTTYWTDVHGNVTFVVDDGALFVEVENPATTEPDELKGRVEGASSPLLRAPVPP